MRSAISTVMPWRFFRPAKNPRTVCCAQPVASATLLREAARVRGTTVLCVSHDPRLIAHADRVLRIEDGLVTSDERPTPTNPMLH